MDTCVRPASPPPASPVIGETIGRNGAARVSPAMLAIRIGAGAPGARGLPSPARCRSPSIYCAAIGA